MSQKMPDPKKVIIPAEDADGNFRMLRVSEVNMITGEVEGDPESAAIFHVGGKKYKNVHSEKGAQGFNEYWSANKHKHKGDVIPGMRIKE
ncbi:hypothetical protein SAMN04487895_12736 [Paenibacillus sophorae]|uniref:Uncharacterized protein n=1 Tax=Paenibacillus sophorae TaxID=1333845 RepID=A0A1H8VSZ8_9BACL|nr:hypothetical protein [Paenibacillus sophorae]QWU15688.1 hypothetical protein KP014_28395 [Paenibacillus sophorae]SEP18444.1 hypothetical protein SAMN04487895_12736 [Paenibacillus sophorae]